MTPDTDPIVPITDGSSGADHRLDRARDIAFVARCSAAATIAYLIANAVGLGHPVWASVSGIIVSQERLDETRTAVLWRLAGTIVGVIAAIGSGLATAMFGGGTASQVAVSVAVSAMVVRRWPLLKVAMWTGPIVFMTRPPGSTLLEAGLSRGGEVLIGGVVGACLHVLAEIAIDILEKRNASR